MEPQEAPKTASKTDFGAILIDFWLIVCCFFGCFFGALGVTFGSSCLLWSWFVASLSMTASLPTTNMPICRYARVGGSVSHINMVFMRFYLVFIMLYIRFQMWILNKFLDVDFDMPLQVDVNMILDVDFNMILDVGFI